MRNTLSRRLGRPVACLAAAAAFAVAGMGCDNGPKPTSDTNGRTNSTSVEAPNTKTIAADSGSFDSTQYFPAGAKSGAVLSVEAMGPKTVRMNKDAQFQFKVTNLTDSPVRNVMLTSTNPDGFQVTGANGSTTQPADKNMMGYAVGDLKPNESKTMTVTGMATKVGMVDTCYVATYSPPTLCTMVQVTNPAVELMVQAPAEADLCQQPFTYTYTVKNTGSGAAHNVMVHEALPEGLMTEDGKNTVDANLGDIEQGGTQVATAKLKAARRGKYDGQAMVTTAGGEGAPAQATSTTVKAPALAVAVAGPPTASTGTQVKYTVTVNNTGDAPSGPVKLVLARSPQMGTVALDGADPSTGAVTLDSIPAGGTATHDATGTSGADAGGAGKLQATASSACAGQAMGDVTTTFAPTPALLLETVDEHDPVTVGAMAIYDIKVTNQSRGPDNNVAVTATIPDGEEFVSVEGPSQPSQAGNVLTFPVVPTLDAKGSVTWKVTVKVVKAGDVQFRTTAKCDGTAGSEKAEGTSLKAQ